MRDHFELSSRPQTERNEEGGGWMTGLGTHGVRHDDRGKSTGEYKEGGNPNWREEHDAWLQDVEDGRASPVLAWQRVICHYEGNGERHDRGKQARKRRHDEDRNIVCVEHSRDHHTTREWGRDDYFRASPEHGRGRTSDSRSADKYLETECRHFLQDVQAATRASGPGKDALAAVQRPVSPPRERPSFFSAPLQPAEPSGQNEAAVAGELQKDEAQQAEQKEKRRRLLLEKLRAKKNTAKVPPTSLNLHASRPCLARMC